MAFFDEFDNSAPNDHGSTPGGGGVKAGSNGSGKDTNTNGPTAAAGAGPSMMESMTNFFECPSCLDTAEDAVETECCHRIYCEACSKDIEEHFPNCPICARDGVAFSVAHTVRRMIGSMPATCPNGCGMKLTRSSLKEHLSKHCPSKSHPCTAQGCPFEYKVANRTGYCDHIRAAHDQLMVDSFDQYNRNGKTAAKAGASAQNAKGAKEAAKIEESKVNAANAVNEDRGMNNGNGCGNAGLPLMDPRVPRRNENGFVARVGSTGKYYCHQVSHIKCGCCDGNCGPTNGHNCVACLKLDLQVRGLRSPAADGNQRDDNSNANKNKYGSMGDNAGKLANDRRWKHPWRAAGTPPKRKGAKAAAKEAAKEPPTERYLVNTDGAPCKLVTWTDRVKTRVKRQKVGFGMGLFFEDGGNGNGNGDVEYKYEMKEKQTFYCGRWCAGVMPLSRGWDGYCGPSNGENCRACGQMDFAYANGSYDPVWEQ